LIVVLRFHYIRPKQEELDQAAPRRKGEENLWECPFCGKNDFPELTEVRLNYFTTESIGKTVNYQSRGFTNDIFFTTCTRF
jgi:hypothetical protein